MRELIFGALIMFESENKTNLGAVATHTNFQLHGFSMKPGPCECEGDTDFHVAKFSQNVDMHAPGKQSLRKQPQDVYINSHYY